jgi:hypothetical protein
MGNTDLVFVDANKRQGGVAVGESVAAGLGWRINRLIVPGAAGLQSRAGMTDSFTSS